MKKIKLLILGMLMTFGSQAVLAQDSTYIANEYSKALAIFTRAQRYNDNALTKQALMEMAVLSPNDTTILRSLAEVYYNENNFVSTVMVALDMQQLHPDDMYAAELAAICFERLSAFDKAIEQYEKIWLKRDDINTLYQIAFLQYSLQRFTEAKTNLDILDDRVKMDDKIGLRKTDGTVQEVSFAAAMSNMRGLISLEEGKKEEAKGHFSKALQLTPDFEAAKVSLDGLNKG